MLLFKSIVEQFTFNVMGANIYKHCDKSCAAHHPTHLDDVRDIDDVTADESGRRDGRHLERHVVPDLRDSGRDLPSLQTRHELRLALEFLWTRPSVVLHRAGELDVLEQTRGLRLSYSGVSHRDMSSHVSVCFYSCNDTNVVIIMFN